MYQPPQPLSTRDIDSSMPLAQLLHLQRIDFGVGRYQIDEPVQKYMASQLATFNKRRRQFGLPHMKNVDRQTATWTSVW